MQDRSTQKRDSLEKSLSSINSATQPGIKYIVSQLEIVLDTPSTCGEEARWIHTQTKECIKYMNTVRPDINPSTLLHSLQTYFPGYMPQSNHPK